MYNLFEGTSKDTNNNRVTTITPIMDVAAMAATTAGTMGTAQPSMMLTVNAKIAAAINQLLANQTAIMTQLAALLVTPAPANPTSRVRIIANVPPIQQLVVPFQQQFPAGDFSASRGGRRGGCGCGRGCGGCGRTLFADYQRAQGGAGVGMQGQIVPHGGGVVLFQPAVPMGTTQVRNLAYSNIYKRHNNWNVCVSCGFDIEDGHTSATCPFKRQIISSRSLVRMYSNSLMPGMTRAPGGCTRQSCHPIRTLGGVGRS
jgi:hypothetical protein